MSAEKGNHTLKMISFVAQYLQPYLKDAQDPLAPNEKLPKFPTVVEGKKLPPSISEDGVLDLRAHVVPRRYEDFKESHQISLRHWPS